MKKTKKRKAREFYVVIGWSEILNRHIPCEIHDSRKDALKSDFSKARYDRSIIKVREVLKGEK